MRFANRGFSGSRGRFSGFNQNRPNLPPALQQQVQSGVQNQIATRNPAVGAAGKPQTGLAGAVANNMPLPTAAPGAMLKKGGAVKAKASSASKRADGCAQRGKTKGRMV